MRLVASRSASASPRSARRHARSPPRRTTRARRAREAEDAAAAAELATDDADALREELAGTKHELHLAIHQRDAAAFSERTCKAKTLRAQEELSERQNELQRLRGKVQALETQRKLERDLAEGRVVGEEDLIRRFRGEVAADPRRAVETLCRSLAGKNRQLHQQVEEYNKLATRLREKERALAAAEVAATAAGANRVADYKREREREPSASGDIAGRAGSLGGRAARGWSRDDDDAWNPEDASLFPRARTKTTKRARRDENFANLTNLSVSATRRDAVAMERFASRGGTGGPLSRAAPARGDGSGLGLGSGSLRSGSSSNGGAADQGENLLDDILEEIDAKTNAKTSANDTSASASHANGASASASRPSTVCRPGRRRSRGAASEAASGTTRARVRIPRGTRATGNSSFTAQTVAAVAQRWFDRAGRASSRGVPLCDARDDARRAKRTRVD